MYHQTHYIIKQYTADYTRQIQSFVFSEQQVTSIWSVDINNLENK